MSRKQFFLVAGSKGGVGKSLAAMALLNYLHARGSKPFLFESDTSNPDVAKCYQNAVETELVDLDTRDGWIALVNRVGELAGRDCVVNTGSRNNVAVQRYSGLLAAGLEELGIELATFWLINGQRDSLELLVQFRSALPNARVHVLRNEYCANSFELYDNSRVRQDVEGAGGTSSSFPELGARVTKEIYNGRLTVEAAESSMPLGNRMEVRRWRGLVGKIFEGVVA